MNRQKFKADNFWQLAQERIGDPNLTDDEVKKRDLTTLYYYELDYKVKNKELINHGISGPVRTGKSTIAAQIAWDVKKLIKKYHGVERPMGNSNILRDQNEYSRVVKRREITFLHEADVIDEWNEMETSGYNSSVESKFLKTFSDVQAGRYYHRFACSPTNITDDNADIILQVIPGSRNKSKTACLLYYRMNTAFFSQPILLGHVVIDVKKTLEADWYQEYLRKKSEKWELMNKHNVKSPRELEYAEIMLQTFNDVTPMAKLGLVSRKHIKPYLQNNADDKGIWFSILGDKDILETIEGMADMIFFTEKQKKKLGRATIEEERSIIQESIVTLQDRLKKSIARLTLLQRLWQEYQLIDENGN